MCFPEKYWKLLYPTVLRQLHTLRSKTPNMMHKSQHTVAHMSHCWEALHPFKPHFRIQLCFLLGHKIVKNKKGLTSKSVATLSVQHSLTLLMFLQQRNLFIPHPHSPILNWRLPQENISHRLIQCVNFHRYSFKTSKDHCYAIASKKKVI